MREHETHDEQKGVPESGPLFVMQGPLQSPDPDSADEQALPTDDPVGAGICTCQNIRSYRVTLRSRGKGFKEEIRYCRREGFVRMDFITPHKGTLLIYNPETKKARLRPVGFLMPTMTLDPGSFLIRSAKGHTVDRSDLGSLLAAIREMQSYGKTDIIWEETVGQRRAVLLSVDGNNRVTKEGIHRYHLWLDVRTFLPVKVITFDLHGGLIEEVVMDDLEVDPELPEKFFEI